jgi:metal-sulfur cluster biosynthetic enzyme
MCQVARVVKDDVENMIDGVRATEVPTMWNLAMAVEWLTTAAPADLPTHPR